MVTAIVILILLTIAASLASWLFGRWPAGRTRISSTALAIDGGGATLPIGTVAHLATGATTWWPRFMPVYDSSPPVPPAALASAAAWPTTTWVSAKQLTTFSTGLRP
jgi:hypothetical protein